MKFRNLNDSEKKDVEVLFKSRWFAIIESIIDEFEHKTLQKYLTQDLKNETVLEALISDKDYLKGAKDFIQLCKWKKSWVWKKKD